MGQENLDLIRAGFAAHNSGDLDALTALYDADAVFETLSSGTHRGREGLRAIYAQNQEALSGYSVEPIELIESSDQVVAVAEIKGEGPGSAAAAAGDTFAFLFTIDRGRIVREQAFPGRQEALAAAGPQD
jgi:ketosteroid isomerase-like protein